MIASWDKQVCALTNDVNFLDWVRFDFSTDPLPPYCLAWYSSWFQSSDHITNRTKWAIWNAIFIIPAAFEFWSYRAQSDVRSPVVQNLMRIFKFSLVLYVFLSHLIIKSSFYNIFERTKLVGSVITFRSHNLITPKNRQTLIFNRYFYRILLNIL